MRKVALYSVLLLVGMFFSQVANLEILQPHLGFFTMVCLAYIMIEVGLEFHLDKKHLSSYGFDYLIAMTAAAFPWIFCALYLYFVIDVDLKEALFVGRFAAPTSAGVLFAMLTAAGLGTTWVFCKARILAIFDDLDTIILLIPLQMMVVGLCTKAVVLLFFIALLFFLAYHFHHRLKVSTAAHRLLLYSFLVVIGCQIVEETISVNFEVLLPAFSLGCILNHPHRHAKLQKNDYDHAHLEPWDPQGQRLDSLIKSLFMFLVGCSLPKVHIIPGDLQYIAGHVLLLTLLSNLGKMFPAFYYRKEASLRERIALSIAMFPRGEVGAGVLLLALEFNLHDKAITLGALCLALNIALTGFFIFAVMKLIGSNNEKILEKTSF